jgi:hypothetical protein
MGGPMKKQLRNAKSLYSPFKQSFPSRVNPQTFKNKAAPYNSRSSK